MNTNDDTTQTIGKYRPKLSFYHPNGKGTGAAVEFELHPAHDNTDGSLMMKIANQTEVGNMRAPNPTFARFDWKNAINVKLDFNDLCHILQVFRGEVESIGEGRGLYHMTGSASTKIVLRHLIDPTPGYSWELYRSVRGSEESVHARILLSSTEAGGLCEAIAGSMYLIGFGIPMLVPHDATAYRARQREARDVSAA